jgi:TPR repeat protein
MKKIAFGVFLLFSCAVYADDMADANKFLQSKAYPQALDLYKKLAQAGNAEAQFHLGEMYLYGEGVGVDAAQAGQWFAQASKAGNKNADAALALMASRVERKGDIDYYVNSYAGEDVALSKFKCVTPVIPGISKTKRQIRDVADSVEAWMACYNSFVANLNASLPPGKAIPSAIEALMNEQEFEKAKLRMDVAYARVSAEGREMAQKILVQRDEWQARTESYLLAENKKIQTENEMNELNRSRSANTPQWVTSALPNK